MCSRNGGLTLGGLSLGPGLCPQAVAECEGSHLPSTKGKGPRARSRDTSRQNDHHEPSTGPFDSNTRAEEPHSAAGKPQSPVRQPPGTVSHWCVPGCVHTTDRHRQALRVPEAWPRVEASAVLSPFLPFAPRPVLSTRTCTLTPCWVFKSQPGLQVKPVTKRRQSAKG